MAYLREAVEHLEKAVARVRVARDIAEQVREVGEATGVASLVKRFDIIVQHPEELEAWLVGGWPGADCPDGGAALYRYRIHRRGRPASPDRHCRYRLRPVIDVPHRPMLL